MKHICAAVIIISLLFSMNNGFGAPSRYEGKIIRKIEFTGLKNTDSDDLKIALESTETDIGFPLNSEEVRKALKLVFKEGEFEKVTAEVEEFEDGVRLRFICIERPVISKIEFRGLDKLDETELETLITVKENEALRINLIENSIKLMKNKYNDSGYFNAEITYKIEKNDVKNTATVIFLVDEGEEIKVGKISILGAKKVKTRQLIKLMETEEDWFLGDGIFKELVYEQDKAKIVAYYKELGYLDAEILEDKVEYEWNDPEKRDKRSIFITIKVSEGERYYFDKYTVAGNKVIDTKTITEKFEQTGSEKIFNDTYFQMDRQSISFAYASKGYISTRVIPNRKIEEREVIVKGTPEKRKFVSIDFQIIENSQAYIENIIIKGNKKTKDKVIRREILLKEGELFNSEKMLVSRDRIYKLGYFSQVDFDVRPGSKEDYMNLIIDVTEQFSGQINMGMGYGTSSDFSLNLDYTYNNFMGNGQMISIALNYGPNSSTLKLGFYEPWLFDNYPIGFSSEVYYNLMTRETFSMFSNTNEKAEYQIQSFGYSLGLSYRFLIYYGVGVQWNHSFSSYQNVSGNAKDELFVEENYGLQENRTVGFYALRDSTDSSVSPTKGWRLKFSTAFTGGTILRGDDHYITYKPEFFLYYTPFHLPFLKTHPCVLELRANGTFLSPPFARRSLEKIQSNADNAWLKSEKMLDLGGPETLRGWDYYKDEFLPESWQSGLYHRITYGAEFRVPVHPQLLTLALFFDAGSLWTDKFWEKSRNENELELINQDKQENNLYDIRDFLKVDNMSYFRYSYGFGFKINVPGVPLRFWFGKRLEWVGPDQGFFRQIKGDSYFNFQFGIGEMRN